MAKTQRRKTKLISRLSVLDENLINKKGFFTRVKDNAELTLKPLDSSPYQKG